MRLCMGLGAVVLDLARLCVCLFAGVLGIESRTVHMSDKCFTTELYT